MGNHEPYGLQFEEALDRVRAFEARIRVQNTAGVGVFIFLNRNHLDMDNRATVLGCNLYSNITED